MSADTVTLGRMAALATRFPERGRTLLGFLLLAVLFALVVIIGKLVERSAPGLLFLIQIAMAMLGVLMFSLIILVQWRRVVDFAFRLGRLPGRMPGMWRVFLLPYPRRDVDVMIERGRLAELLTLPVVLIISLGLLLAVILPHESKAKESAMTEMRTTVQATQADLARDYLQQPFQSPYPAFAFTLAIRKDWLWFEKEGQPDRPNGKLQKLAAYGDRSDQSLIEVYALALEREIAPEDWLEQWVITNQYQVLGHRSIPSTAGRNADVLAKKMVAGRPVLYRLRTFKNGKFLYLLHSFSDEAHYPQVEEAFLVAAQTFRLTQAPQQAYAEPLQDLPLNKVFQLGFKAPTSWTAQPDNSVGADSQSWIVSNGQGAERLGILNIYAAPRDSFASAQAAGDQVAGGMRGLGADITKNPLRTVESDIPGVSLSVSSLETSINGKPATFRQTVVGTAKGWAVFSLLSPAPHPDLYLISPINRRAYDIAFGSFLSALVPK